MTLPYILKIQFRSLDAGLMKKRREFIWLIRWRFFWESRKHFSYRTDTSRVWRENFIQVGGGIRDIETVERLINIGATYVVIGTAAVNDPVFLERVCSKFSNKIIVALDARDGKIATHGWSETTKLTLLILLNHSRN